MVPTLVVVGMYGLKRHGSQALLQTVRASLFIICAASSGSRGQLLWSVVAFTANEWLFGVCANNATLAPFAIL